ncbi:MAG: DUF4142 domain-containing protein [Betaproteobacteria bacterium]|nr:DUF4142 domain-containing protein [Betaproteobacteria bacterium]
MSKLIPAAAFALAFALSPALAQSDKSSSSSSSDGTASAKSGKKLDRADQKILRDMAESDMAEVETGKLAASKAQSDDVKKFAQQMQDDHGKNLDEVKSLADSKGAKLPSSPSMKHKAAAKKLESASGADFDKTYMAEMVKDHQEDLKKLKDASRKAKDADVKAAADKTASTVQGHLKMAQDIASGLGASQGSSSK